MVKILQFGFVEIQCQQEGTDIGGSLGDFYAGQVKAQRQDEDHGQKTDALSCGGQYAGWDGVADGLE